MQKILGSILTASKKKSSFSLRDACIDAGVPEGEGIIVGNCVCHGQQQPLPENQYCQHLQFYMLHLRDGSRNRDSLFATYF